MSLYEQTRKEFVDLLKMKGKIAKYSTALNREIMQTDVEWMNLSDLAKRARKTDEDSPQKNEITEKKESITGPTDLDLNPVKNRPNGFEEFDSESE
ncbi:hypothetical protein TcasGA2_TC013584 [Tribolium castaneum]|uniref:Uncharacterized protein n=1 Tax=Tribolium castaneum TaxID=7070 RepID=D6W750_TRICA|nr:hypothetical protein TcasGA2_TC013584 [Tribolium castaneum]